MRWRLFSLASVMSAVICAAACVLGARGYRAYDDISWTRASVAGTSYYRWYFTLASGQGGVGAMLDAEVYDATGVTGREAARPRDRWERLAPRRQAPAYPRPWSAKAARRWGGFVVLWVRTPDTIARDVIVPVWSITLATAVLPAAWLVRFRDRRVRAVRRRRGLCPGCGYDLRATPGRCPECGRAAEPGPAAGV